MWLALALTACVDPTEGTRVALDPEGDFWDMPLPSAHRRGDDDRVTLAGFPNPEDNPYVAQLVALIDGQLPGFGNTSAVFFRVPGGVDVSALPDLRGSTRDDSPVFLLGFDGEDAGVRVPVDVAFLEDGGPYGADDMLVLLPLQGRPLLAGGRYAAVVTRELPDARGEPLAASPLLLDLWRGEAVPLPREAAEAYDAALVVLDAKGLAPTEIAGVAAFRTQDPTVEMAALVAAVRSEATPRVRDFALTDVFDDYCVYRSTLDLPVFQEGTPPYLDGGGTIAWGDGVPVLQRFETANVDVTVPRAAMPDGGWPVAVFVRTGGGGDRPLVDRGVRDGDGTVLDPGGGPARVFAAAGYAGVSVDGPHGGARNVTHGDEQFLVFNVGNPGATRDNLRQSAAELALLPRMIDGLEVATADCPGAGDVASFRSERIALMGHSMGASIAPLAAWAEPDFGALVLSGAGGSWIHNVVYKQSPIEVRPVAEQIVGAPLHPHDPVLSLLQWGGELADVPPFAVSTEARDVLMLQGIVDTYILPPIANATSLSYGLDLAGASLDAASPELDDFTPLEELLPFVGSTVVGLPVTDNRDGFTRVVVQHPEDGVEDGHEVVFQTSAPKVQIRCFLSTWAEAAPTVVDPASPCP